MKKHYYFIIALCLMISVSGYSQESVKKGFPAVKTLDISRADFPLSSMTLRFETQKETTGNWTYVIFANEQKLISTVIIKTTVCGQKFTSRRQAETAARLAIVKIKNDRVYEDFNTAERLQINKAQ